MRKIAIYLWLQWKHADVDPKNSIMTLSQLSEARQWIFLALYLHCNCGSSGSSQFWCPSYPFRLQKILLFISWAALSGPSIPSSIDIQPFLISMTLFCSLFPVLSQIIECSMMLNKQTNKTQCLFPLKIHAFSHPVTLWHLPYLVQLLAKTLYLFLRSTLKLFGCLPSSFLISTYHHCSWTTLKKNLYIHMSAST